MHFYDKTNTMTHCTSHLSTLHHHIVRLCKTWSHFGPKYWLKIGGRGGLYIDVLLIFSQKLCVIHLYVS